MNSELNGQELQPRVGRVDPEPFTVTVGIAAIVGGVASIISAYRSLVPNQSFRQRRKLRVTFGEADDLLRYLEADIGILRDLLQTAEIRGDRRFQLGSRAFLTVEDFDRYAQLTDNMYSRLRKLLACTHAIERAFARIEPFVGFEPASHLDGVQGIIGRLLRDPELTVEQAVDDLERLVRLTRGMVQDLGGAMRFEA